MLATLASRAFKGTAFLALILIDIGVALAIWDNFGQMSWGAWLAAAGLVFVNFFMFFPEAATGVARAAGTVGVVILIAAVALLGLLLVFEATRALHPPPWMGIAIVIGIVVIVLFKKLDAINANIARANELKRRELDRD
jgi:hypothetical protein